MTDQKATRLGLGAALALSSLPFLLAPSSTASAQEWPARTVTVIVPLGAGSASDVMARVVMEQVGKQLGRTFIVENRPGAGGTTGANTVANAAPDGYTILAYGALSTAHALYAKLPYDTLTAFAPVIPFGQQPLVLITAPSNGYKTLGDLVAAGKSDPRRAQLLHRGRRIGVALRGRALAHQRRIRGAAHSVPRRGRSGDGGRCRARGLQRATGRDLACTHQ